MGDDKQANAGLMHYDSAREIFRAEDGTEWTREQVSQLQTGHPVFQQGSQQAGRRAAHTDRSITEFKRAHQGRDDVDRAHLAYILERVMDTPLIMWVSKRRFTYAAVRAGDTWYITGSGEWYGKNVFTKAEFIDDVITHVEVTAIHLPMQVELLWVKP